MAVVEWGYCWLTGLLSRWNNIIIKLFKCFLKWQCFCPCLVWSTNDARSQHPLDQPFSTLAFMHHWLTRQSSSKSQAARKALSNMEGPWFVPFKLWWASLTCGPAGWGIPHVASWIHVPWPEWMVAKCKGPPPSSTHRKGKVAILNLVSPYVVALQLPSCLITGPASLEWWEL